MFRNGLSILVQKKTVHSLKGDTGSKIEGIGRPRVEPSFIAGVIDEMRKIPDAASVLGAKRLPPHSHANRRHITQNDLRTG